jgi:hypothetical protein
MPQLPLVVWVFAAAVAVLLLALCAVTVYAVLRLRARHGVAQWPASRVLILLAAAVVPWVAVRVAPIQIRVNIHGTAQLIGWLVLALAAFAILVLLPLAAILCTFVWWNARRRRGEHTPPPI